LTPSMPKKKQAGRSLSILQMKKPPKKYTVDELKTVRQLGKGNFGTVNLVVDKDGK